MSKPNTPLPKFTTSGIESDHLGLCIECHEIAEGVEPDARNYCCDACGAKAVYGLEELIVMGYDILADEPDDTDGGAE